MNDGASLLLHKRQDDGAQWIYRYTIHGRNRELTTQSLRLESTKELFSDSFLQSKNTNLLL